MSGLSRGAAALSPESDRPNGRDTDQMVEDVLSDIARALWPNCTAANIASRAKCTVRAAERYLEGSRDWSGDAIAAIVAEIMRRHSMRNFKVKAK